MRIGFLGNPNNYPFMVARALKELGHDVRFIVSSSSLLDRPEGRYVQFRAGYPDWVIDCAPRIPRFSKSPQIEHLVMLLDAGFPTSRHRRVIKALRDCDGIVVSGAGPSYAAEIGRPSFAMITGNDLETLAFRGAARKVLRDGTRATLPYRAAVALLLRRVFSRQQRGYRLARGVSYFVPGTVPVGDALLRELGVRNDRRVFLMMTDLDEVAAAPPPYNEVVRVFSGARLTWKRPLPNTMGVLDDKGSDVMLTGIATYLQRSGDRLNIRLVRKGMHVAETEALVRELRIERHVTWLNEMSQVEIRDEYASADIVFDQLGPGFLGMVTLDAMACGRPVIANGRPEIVESFLGEPSPLCQARTPEEVAEQLVRLVSSRAERERIGKASRSYVEKFFSPRRAAEIILDRLRSAA